LNNTANNSENTFKNNLREAIKTFATLAILIFFLILSFYVLAIIFPENVTYDNEAFIFGYIMAIPFMFGLSLYPFGKK
jgi:hypothetical protein